MMRAMIGVKLMDKKTTKELMEMMGLTGPVVSVMKVNAVNGYGHVQRKEQDNVLRVVNHPANSGGLQ